MKNKHYNIFCLQDTHFTPELENIIRAEWGYDCYFNSFRSNARGVAILLNNNFEVKVLQVKRELSGNFLALDMRIEGRKVTLITLYGPNSDNPEFYENLTETIDLFGNDSFIICGDFNLVLNPTVDYDKSYKNVNNPKATDKIIELIEELGMVDIYREQHPENRRYTWRRSNPVKQARLDFFLISDNLLPSIHYSNIEPGYRTDHSLHLIALKFNEFRKGKGLWKFNNSLLHDLDYLELINKLILDIKRQYALPVYHLENISNIPDSDIQFMISDQLFFGNTFNRNSRQNHFPLVI